MLRNARPPPALISSSSRRIATEDLRATSPSSTTSCAAATPDAPAPTNMPCGMREVHVADPDGNVIRFGTGIK
jgi:hypothetical protein